MDTAKTKVTVSLDRDVYEGIKARVGGRKIGAFLSQLARPQVVAADVEAGYRALAADTAREAAATAWTEAADESLSEENTWQF